MKSESIYKSPVVIFGTTPDYVVKLSDKYHHDMFFIIDGKYETDRRLKDMDPRILLFSALDDLGTNMENIINKFSDNGVSPRGIGCFDCESLIGASELAHRMNLPFPETGPIISSRNKFESKEIWNKSGIPCPKASLGSNIIEALEFFESVGSGIVLKPISGSGSELTFCCNNEREIKNVVEIISSQLENRKSNPLFKELPSSGRSDIVDPCSIWVLEEYINGHEFSCDFTLQDEQVTLIRVIEKRKDDKQTFGSILAYITPPTYPEGFSISQIPFILKNAVRSLGFTWGWFMADFIIKDTAPYIIEITPRPGGDSIPDLIEIATGEDILGIYLDFVSGRIKEIRPIPFPAMPFVSLNLYADQEGVISQMDTSGVEGIPWVEKLFLSRQVGDSVLLPPLDYDSRKIGHCIIPMDPSNELKEKQEFLINKIRLSISDHCDDL